MNIILLQADIATHEIDHLLQEFPQYLFLSFNENTYKNLSPQDWARVEVLYGGRLTPEELAMAHQLHWIHSPTPSLSRLCMKKIEEQGNILVTNTKGENITQIGEFVMGGILAFAKNLFQWKELSANPSGVWDSRLRDAMWTLKDRLLLQIGLGSAGSEITRRAQIAGMHTWGATENRSFHPYCDKVFDKKDLHSILPNADIVSICLPRGKEYENWFGENELKLMKDNSILVILGSHRTVNEDALFAVAEKGKFRGILLDAFYQLPVPVGSILWKIPNIIITPEVAPRPKISSRQAYRIFRYNLRQYIHGNFNDMRNLESTPLLRKSK